MNKLCNELRRQGKCKLKNGELLPNELWEQGKNKTKRCHLPCDELIKLKRIKRKLEKLKDKNNNKLKGGIFT